MMNAKPKTITATRATTEATTALKGVSFLDEEPTVGGVVSEVWGSAEEADVGKDVVSIDCVGTAATVTGAPRAPVAVVSNISV
jgi:hypothetical protein